MSQDIWSYIVELHNSGSNSDSNSTTSINKITFFEYLSRIFSKYIIYIISCKLHTPRNKHYYLHFITL